MIEVKADVEGLVRRFHTSDVVKRERQVPYPFVPKDHLVGRAFATMVGLGKSEFQLLAESARQNADRIKAELDSIALEGLPKEKIVEKIRQIRAAMQAEAEEVARRRQELMRGSDADIEQDKAGKGVKNTAKIELERKVRQIQEQSVAELEALEIAYRDKQDLLNRARGQDLIDEDAYNATSAAIKRKYEEQKTAIEDNEIKKRWGIANVYRCSETGDQKGNARHRGARQGGSRGERKRRNDRCDRRSHRTAAQTVLTMSGLAHDRRCFS